MRPQIQETKFKKAVGMALTQGHICTQAYAASSPNWRRRMEYTLMEGGEDNLFKNVRRENEK